MDSEKKVSFTGVDNGVSSQLEKLRRQTNDLGADMIRQSREYSKSGRGQLSFIEEQIRAIQRRNQLDREGQELNARKAYSATGDKDAFSSRMSQIGIEGREDNMQVKLLRELIDTIKTTAKEEIAEDRKDVEKQIALLNSGRFEGTAEEELKVKYQEELLRKDDKKGKGVMGDVFAGTFLANTLSSLGRAASMLPSARNEEEVIGNMLSELPLGFGVVGGAYQRSTEEQLKAEIATQRLYGLTGRRPGVGSMVRFGYDTSETMAATEGAYRARGGSLDMEGFIGAQRAFSLDQGFMERRAGLQRFSGGEQDFLDNMLEIFNQLSEDQRIIFQEVAQNQTQLVQDFSQSAETVNQSLATETLMKFGAVGGGFSLGDPRSMQRIQTINQALSRPQNDIMQAENFSILREIDPNAGIFDIQKMQEQGLQNPQLLPAIMRNIRRRYGGDSQMAMTALQKRTGLSFSATEQLYNNFDAFQAEGLDPSQMMDRLNVIQEGGARTAGLEKSQAAIANAFVEGALPGMLKVADLVGKKIGDTIRTAMGATTEQDREMNTKGYKKSFIPGVYFPTNETLLSPLTSER